MEPNNSMQQSRRLRIISMVNVCWRRTAEPVHWAVCVRTPSILLGLVLSAVCARSAESAFFRNFMDSVDANDFFRVVAVTSSSLVDTNNRTVKLGAATNTLVAMRERGSVSGVQLGMTMSEVVAQWGKPPRFYTKCRTGPHFAYSDVGLYFEGDSLCEVYVPASNLDLFYRSGSDLRFENGLTGSSKIYDVQRTLGEPTRHTANVKEEREYLVYESPSHALIVAFDSESRQMSHITLQKRGAGPIKVR